MDATAFVATLQQMGSRREEPSPDYRVWVRRVVIATVLLNLLDVILTVFWVNAGFATEVNPLMENALELGAGPFAAAKLSLVSLSLYLLWLRRDRVLAVAGVVIALCAYLCILYCHLQAVNLLVARMVS